MGLVQKENLVVFHFRVPQETERHQRKKNTGVSSLKQAVNNERRKKGKEQAPSSVPTEKGQTEVKKLEKSGGQPCDWS